MALLYHSCICVYLFFLVRQTSALALSIHSSNQTDKSHIRPHLPLSKPAPNLQVQQTVGTAIDNLLHSLAAKEDIRFRQAALVSVNLYVNDQFSPYGLDRSRNIRAFRSIVTFFHIGGPEPAPPARDGICVRNQFPHPWEQWHAPFFVGDIPGRRERGLHALAWEQVWEQMSITRADYLLKRAGYLGKYGQ
ncbi:MAG: hypothetical protein Q9224_007778, partial [Gallowayella concinna]